MIKPTPTIIYDHEDSKRNMVSYDDYRRLEKYCAKLEDQKVSLKTMVSQCHDIIREYQQNNGGLK